MVVNSNNCCGALSHPHSVKAATVLTTDSCVYCYKKNQCTAEINENRFNIINSHLSTCCDTD